MYSAPMMQRHIPALDRSCLDLPPAQWHAFWRTRMYKLSLCICLHACTANMQCWYSKTCHALKHHACIPHKGSLMVAPQSILNHSLIPRPSPALFLDHIHDLPLYFLDWIFDLFKGDMWSTKQSVRWPGNEGSWTISSDYEFCWWSESCMWLGTCCTHLDKMSPWVQVWQWGLAVNLISGFSWWWSLLSGWFYHWVECNESRYDEGESPHFHSMLNAWLAVFEDRA